MTCGEQGKKTHINGCGVSDCRASSFDSCSFGSIRENVDSERRAELGSARAIPPVGPSYRLHSRHALVSAGDRGLGMTRAAKNPTRGCDAVVTSSPKIRVMLDALNFLLTNRIPRRLATTLAGRVAKIESRLLTNVGIKVWETLGGSLELEEAANRDFTSLQAVFTRRLKDGARPIDAAPDVLASPCDAIVGAHGVVEQGMAIQAKGLPYSLLDLLLDPRLVERHRGGRFVTLRLRSTMYHRFHAPCDGRVRSVRWIAGDTWNEIGRAHV